ncbi:MAG: enoyl-CoA hydratase [Pseudomonadota bacterium]
MSTSPSPDAATATTPIDEGDLLYRIEDGVGIITFNRPQARNALTFSMYEQVAGICSSIPDDGSVHALVLHGAGGKAFAAGTDISLFRDFTTPEQGIAYEEAADRNMSAIEACPVPTIAAINGACTGGGAGIAACCDLRYTSADLKFGFPIARTLGNCLSAATLARLKTLMGEARVKDLIITSRLMRGDEALRVGLVSEVFETGEDCLTHAMSLARDLKGHAPLTMRVTKTLLHALRDQAPGDVDDEAMIAQIYTSADFKEGMDAFLTKRKPQWRGR